jgi:heme-degrading monooxygenase HmoA
MFGFAPLPDPPYWAVIFTTIRHDGDHGYAAMADAMEALATKQPGYIGIETVRAADGQGITVSYWDSEAAIVAWKKVVAHAAGQKLGRERWYKHYRLRVAKVERAYSGPEGRG